MKKLLKNLFIAFISFFSIGFINLGYEDDFLYGEPTEADWDQFERELEGTSDLGAVRKSFNRLRRKARTSKTKNSKSLLESTMDRGQRYLRAKVDKLPPSMAQSFKNKTLNYSDTVIYHNTPISTFSGIVELVKSNEKVEPGWTNLNDQGIVPKDLAMAIDYIALVINEYHDANGPFSEIYGAMFNKPQLAAADVEVVINGEIARTLPLRVFNETRILRNSIPSGSHAGYNLSSPIFLKENDKIQIRIKMPDGTSITAALNNHMGARFEFYGNSLSSK